MFEDPPVDGHRPSSGKSQDISHLLASIFKDVYTKDIIGKDTLSNLVKTKMGRSSYHERIVEELQQAHSDYQRSIEEADFVENHIIQATARALERERRAYEEIMENVGDQGLFKVQSGFSWCVDEELLQRNNLISPRDFSTRQKPREHAPVAVKSSHANPTLSFIQHTSRELSEFPLIPKKTVLDTRLTFQSSTESQMIRGVPTKKPNQIRSRPKWTVEPSTKDRENWSDELQRFKDRQDFLRNPRFLPPIEHQGRTSLRRPKGKTKRWTKGSEDQSSTDDPAPVFQAKPSVIMFTDYTVGDVYESTLELTNVTSTSRHVRVIPPTTQYFSIGLGRFPGKGGIVAPGMSCMYTLRFRPDSLGNYSDFVVVETQAEQVVVPIKGQRPPPILTLPRVLDCGDCLVGGVKFVEFQCQNVGLSSGMFYVAPKDKWSNSNLRSASRMCFSEQPPFVVGPSLFELQPGETTFVEVIFSPTAEERSSKSFTIVCDNCQVKDISIKGEGHFTSVELVSVSGQTEPLTTGEVHGVTAEHFVRFSSCNPHTVQQKTLVIRNKIHMELPFFWQIMKPNLQVLLPGHSESSNIHFHPATDDVFHISPTSGVLAPCQDQVFLLTFSPKQLEDYHSVCHLVLKDVPQLLPEPSESSVLQPVQTGYRVQDVTTTEIEVRGSTEPYQILLEPYAVIIPAEILMCTTVRRHFKMWNNSKTFIWFQWEKLNSCHVIEVKPPAGRIEENQCLDFDLILTGGKPEKVETVLVCNIRHHHEPVCLAVEVSFKGPTVTLGVPSVDFGLVRLGEQTRTTFLLTNTTSLKSSWTLEEKLPPLQDPGDTQISVEPREGVLPPLASCNVEMVFRPHFCQQFETELELKVEDGAGCHLQVRADVQSPQVCLRNAQLVFSDLYVGVSASGSVTLFNRTLLPSHFSWMAQLQGEQAALCTASFDPSSGTLGPNESTEITVNFTSHTRLELTEVAAVCEVEGMNLPLVLDIVASRTKKLCVSYSLPSDRSTQQDCNPSAPVLDFGDVTLKRAATKQLLITNQTAIPAPFTIDAEYFTCHIFGSNNQSEKRSAQIKKHLHPLQAKKIEMKAREEFVSSLLAGGKGAAFQVLPDSGLLGPFETQTVDVTAYTDMWGEYRDDLICKVGDLEPVRILMKMTVKGCPLYFPQANDRFQRPPISFGTHVFGGDTVSRLIHIKNPTMFDIRVNWETYNLDPNDNQLVDVLVSYGEHFPLKDADGHEVHRALRLFNQTTWERSHTSVSVGPSSCLQSVTDVDKEQLDERQEEEATCFFSPVRKNLISVHIRPHLGHLSDDPFSVTPSQIVIPAKSKEKIQVCFTPLTPSASEGSAKCAGFVLGFMSLDSETAVCVPGKVRREQGLDLEPFRLDLQAAVKHVMLVVQMDEDDGVLEFNASAGDLLRAKSNKKVAAHDFDVTQSLQLINTAETPVRFRLETRPPFSVVKPQAGDGLVLQPQRNMQVKLAFHCSPSLLDHVDQTEEGVSPGVRLIHNERGQRTLKFQQNLQIQHSNNSLQTVPLCASLALPTLSLSADSLSFGFCYVGETQSVEIKLCSRGAHTYWKTLTKSDEEDPRVFRVTPDSGLLRTQKPHTTNCSQSLRVSFTPSEDREFRAVVEFQSPLVKTPVTLQLQGTGSTEEAYRTSNCDTAATNKHVVIM